jgi:hypothetical protein
VRHHEPDLGVLPEDLRGPVGAALAKDPAERPAAQEVLLGLIGGDGDTGRMLDAGSRAAAQRRTALRLAGGPGQERTAIVSVAFSPDGRTIATGDDAGAVRLWDAANGSPVGGAFTGHSSDVLALAFTPDGRGLLAVDDRGILKEHVLDAGRAAAALCARYGRGLTEAEWRRYVPEVPYRRTC